MSDNSRIEWTDATWNVVVGCTKVSPGCDHCYAERDVNRWNGERAFDTVVLKPERLALPFRWRAPRRIFVNSLSDLFHDDVPDAFIVDVFGVMAANRRHTFQLLTKRHGRMRSLLRDETFQRQVFAAAGPESLTYFSSWPLDNVWLGVSVENQHWADIRVPALLDTPAAVRFLSCEPLLGPIDLFDARLLRPGHCSQCGGEWSAPACGPTHALLAHDRGIGWIIAGGESGPGARPMHAEWARSLRDQCDRAGVPYLFKQWGQHDEHGQRRRSKHDAGRELDGRTHDEFPATAVLA